MVTDSYLGLENHGSTKESRHKKVQGMSHFDTVLFFPLDGVSLRHSLLNGGHVPYSTSERHARFYGQDRTIASGKPANSLAMNNRSSLRRSYELHAERHSINLSLPTREQESRAFLPGSLLLHPRSSCQLSF